MGKKKTKIRDQDDPHGNPHGLGSLLRVRQTDSVTGWTQRPNKMGPEANISQLPAMHVPDPDKVGWSQALRGRRVWLAKQAQGFTACSEPDGNERQVGLH